MGTDNGTGLKLKLWDATSSLLYRLDSVFWGVMDRDLDSWMEVDTSSLVGSMGPAQILRNSSMMDGTWP